MGTLSHGTVFIGDRIFLQTDKLNRFIVPVYAYNNPQDRFRPYTTSVKNWDLVVTFKKDAQLHKSYSRFSLPIRLREAVGHTPDQFYECIRLVKDGKHEGFIFHRVTKQEMDKLKEERP